MPMAIERKLGTQMEHAYLHEHSPFDRMMDTAFAAVGVKPELIKSYLAGHKKGTRIAANTMSLTRVVLGEVVIRRYEKARTEKNEKAIIGSIISLAGIMVTDGLDGYLSRKAGIDDSVSGKIIDSACDVYLRARIARSSILAEVDLIDKTRFGAEALVAWSAIPDMLMGKYTSTSLGKVKVPADAVATLADMLKDLAPEKSSYRTTLGNLSKYAREIGAVLALADGVIRFQARRRKNRS